MSSSKSRETTDRRNKKKVPKYFSSPRVTSASIFPRLASDDSLGSEDGPSSRTAGHDEEELITAYTLRPNDVLFGRGSGPNGFAGNVRYRNLIRSILINACKMDNVDASTDHGDLPDFFLPDTDQEISIARRNRILAIQVVKAIKSRKGRFLQRVSCPSSLSSKPGNSSTSFSNHIERVVYKEVEESVAFEKTKQNFRDQMRLLEMEQEGIQISTGSNEEPPEDSWVGSNTSCLTGGKRTRDNDYSLPADESLNVRRHKMTRILSSQEMEMQHDYALVSRTCHPPPTPTLNSYNLLAPRSVPCDSFYPKDDMILLSRPQHAFLMSQIGDPRDHGCSYMHFPPTTQPLFIQEMRPIVNNNTRPPFLEDHLRMKSNVMIHDPPAFLVKEDLHPSSNVLLSLGGSRNDIFSHRLVASSPRPSTTSLHMPVMSRGHYGDGPVAFKIVTPPAGSRTTGQVQAMITSHQTRRDRFWTGWAAKGAK